MTSLLAQIIMGWPAILVSLLVTAIGIASKRAAFSVAGAVLCLGFAWYLWAWPNLLFDLLGISLPFTHLLAGLAVYRQKAWLAWLLLLPHASAAAFLAAILFAQFRTLS